MSSDVVEPSSVLDRPSIKKIKREILDRALDRHRKIQRGECDVPIHYVPLPVATLYDLLAQLEFRANSLSLAVPPPCAGLVARCKRQVKQLVCKLLRWILMRQVEFNQVSLEHAREISEQLASADRNLGEFIASFAALKLQAHNLSERLRRLEYANQTAGKPIEPEPAFVAPESEHHLHQALWPFLKGRGPVLLLQTSQIDLLKFLISEGLDARGVETNAETIETAREQELPIESGEPAGCLGHYGDDSLDVVLLGEVIWQNSAQEVNRLLALVWRKLRQGGLVLARANNVACMEALLPVSNDQAVKAVPVELLTYVLESQCFWVADMLFWHPVSEQPDPVAQASKCWTYDVKQYRSYMLIGVKE